MGWSAIEWNERCGIRPRNGRSRTPADDRLARATEQSKPETRADDRIGGLPAASGEPFRVPFKDGTDNLR